jgi:hypothetical protein
MVKWEKGGRTVISAHPPASRSYAEGCEVAGCIALTGRYLNQGAAARIRALSEETAIRHPAPETRPGASVELVGC